MSVEYIVYCDESASKGKHFSDFYGGALVISTDLPHVTSEIAAKKKALNFGGEVKWGKVTWSYAEKYIALVDCLFDLVAAGKIKLRIMFRQNTIRHRRLTKRHHEDKYFILYYTFIKWGFGLDRSPIHAGGVNLRVYLDKIPDTQTRVEKFRSFIVRLSQRPELRARNIRIRREDVTDVNSHEHDILQCLDIVLGSMNFRLNDLHLEKPIGSKRRSQRTRAKERVYKHINQRIREIYPNFNIGISTGQRDFESRWRDPYRHWRLVPAEPNRVIDRGSKKDKKAKTP